MFRIKIPLLFFFAALINTTLCINLALAETGDPINIEADNAKLNEKEGKSIYSGNVLLIQGNIRVTADVVTVFSNGGRLTKISATGKPVKYQQRNQPKEDDIQGEANLLEYFASEDRVVLSDDAKLTQGHTFFSGNRIEYNTKTDIVTAAVSDTGKQRVQVTIQPPDNKKARDKEKDTQP